MLSNQVLNKIIADIYGIIEVDCSVWNPSGECLASTSEEPDKMAGNVKDFMNNEENEWVGPQGSFFWIYDNEELTYILAIHEKVENALVTGRLCVCQFEHLIQAYKARVDKNRFYQNLLLDNLLLVDIFNQAKKVNVATEARRTVFVVEPKKESDNLVLETMKGLYATGTKDFVTAVDEKHIVYVRSLEKTEGQKELTQIAKTIVDMLNTEVMVNVRVAYGTIVDSIKDVSKSYKEALMALDVGKSFYAEKTVLAYSELGIGRLIHQLPLSLCDMFLKEVFSGNALELLDEETLSTVNAFFENSLNISETARKMYVHRNTLVYRLEKIQKTTGLDVRVFDDALTFKIALMVAKHMKRTGGNEI